MKIEKFSDEEGDLYIVTFEERMTVGGSIYYLTNEGVRHAGKPELVSLKRRFVTTLRGGSVVAVGGKCFRRKDGVYYWPYARIDPDGPVIRLFIEETSYEWPPGTRFLAVSRAGLCLDLKGGRK